MLVAVDIMATRFLSVPPSPVTGFNRIGPQFLAHGLAGWILGPVPAIVTAIAGDVLGMFINSAGAPYLPLFAIVAAFRGFLYGVMLYRRKPNFWFTLLAVALITVLCDLTLATYTLAPLYGQSWWALLLFRAPVRLATIPVYAGLLFAMQKALERSRVLRRDLL
jgi:ECF transporter S component (folate family)